MAEIFAQQNRTITPKHVTTATRYEIARTLVEFLAAVAFIIGSVMFFWASWQDAGTWLFLIGSILFAVRPTVRLAMELHLASLPE